MYADNKIKIGMGEKEVCLLPNMANRHGLIAGATGTGKTVTLKVLAEAFSEMGTPVFLADVKGDVSSLAKKGEMSDKLKERIAKFGLTDLSFTSYPVRFFDVFGKKGIPVRTTISDIGPDLLARVLNLNDTQKGVMSVIFKIADDKQMLLLDLKDLKAMVQHVGDCGSEYKTAYGNVSTQSVGAIQRAILQLEQESGENFFSEPALEISDWLQVDSTGKGIINLLDCTQLINTPLLYSTFLLWMLSELYEHMEEVGDCDKPKIVFFFDEAHLLFADASKELLQKIEQITKLIRSKGVGIYFITQSPSDIPDSVLSQLGNKIQHALRAYTPKDQKALKSAAQAFRTNPAFDTVTVLQELATGEALISPLDENGAPCVVERAFVYPPLSSFSIIDDATRSSLISACPLYAKYNVGVDRTSAFEILQQQEVLAEKQEALQKEQAEQLKEKQQLAKQQSAHAKQSTKRKSEAEKIASSVIGSFGREAGRQLFRGLLGSLLKR